ncbi:MAG: iron ABC transporter permease [Chloroflexi bacterium]|nr:iron ABC transporter permease [Chloroflexota bacterium]
MDTSALATAGGPGTGLPGDGQEAAARGRRRALDPAVVVALVLSVAFVLIAIVWPVLAVIGAALTDGAIPIFQRYLSPPQNQILVNTVVLGVVVATVGTAIAFLFAFVQVRVPANRWLKRVLHVIALLPIVSPPFALAIAAISLFGRSGMITRDLLGMRVDIYGLPGLTLVMSLSFFPVAYVSLMGLMRALDPALDEAAANLGSSKLRIFRTVTVPLLLPGLASGFLLLFVEALADLGNPLVLGGNFTVLSSRLYIAIIGQYDMLTGSVLAVLLLVPSLIVYFVHRYYAERASVVSVTGKPTGRPSEVSGRPARAMLLGAACLVAGLIVLLYGTIVVGSFTKLLGVDHTLTLRNYEAVLFGYGTKAVTDTTLLAGLATPLAGLLGVVIAFLVIRGRFPGRGALDFGTMLGVAVPGTIFGIGYLLVFNVPVQIAGFTIIPKLTGGAALLGGALAILLVYILRSAPGGLRAGAASLQQIDPSIEEASISLGADQATTFRKVVLPLIRPAFLSGLIYSFARSMTAISAVIFLTTPQIRIMTQQILNETDAARYGNAYAYCVILILIVLAAIGILSVLVGSSTRAERTSGVNVGASR